MFEDYVENKINEKNITLMLIPQPPLRKGATKNEGDISECRLHFIYL
jgi:hypothetical protein